MDLSVEHYSAVITSVRDLFVNTNNRTRESLLAAITTTQYNVNAIELYEHYVIKVDKDSDHHMVVRVVPTLSKYVQFGTKNTTPVIVCTTIRQLHFMLAQYPDTAKKFRNLYKNWKVSKHLPTAVCIKGWRMWFN